MNKLWYGLLVLVGTVSGCSATQDQNRPSPDRGDEDRGHDSPAARGGDDEAGPVDSPG